jgi:hypothetical protein
MGTKLRMRCLALLAVATLVMADQQLVSGDEVEFDSWLQDMAETSDVDDTDLPPAQDADAVTGAWKGEASELLSQDKDGSLKNKHPKWNGDSIGVQPKPTGKPTKVVVSQDGKGDFTTINAAIDAIPYKSTHRTVIHIKAGVYKYFPSPLFSAALTCSLDTAGSDSSIPWLQREDHHQ